MGGCSVFAPGVATFATAVEPRLGLVRGAGLPDDEIRLGVPALGAQDAGLRQGGIVLGDDGSLLLHGVGSEDLRFAVLGLGEPAFGAHADVFPSLREHHRTALGAEQTHQPLVTDACIPWAY